MLAGSHARACATAMDYTRSYTHTLANTHIMSGQTCLTLCVGTACQAHRTPSHHRPCEDESLCGESRIVRAYGTVLPVDRLVLLHLHVCIFGCTHCGELLKTRDRDRWRPPIGFRFLTVSNVRACECEFRFVRAIISLPNQLGALQTIGFDFPTRNNTVSCMNVRSPPDIDNCRCRLPRRF